MAYNKRNWKARQGTGLNFFSINGATPVPIVNQPTTLTEAGDALSAGNLNDWEQRIADGFDSASGELADAVEELESEDTALRSAITANSNRIANLEQKAGDYSIVQYRGTNAVPTGKAKYGLVKSIVGKSRAWNQLQYNGNFASADGWAGGTVSSGHIEASGSANSYSRVYTTNNNPSIIQGHVYYGSAKMKVISGLSSGYTSYNLRIGGEYAVNTALGFGSNSIADGTTVTARGLFTASADNSGVNPIKYWGCHNDTNAHTVQWSDIFLYDLTLIFGAGNEPSTVEEALAQLPALGQYNAYDAGSLVDTVVSGVKSVGFNTLDELAYYNEVGAVKDSDGYYTATADDWHNHVFNEIKFKSNMVYNFHFTIKNNGVGNPQLVIYYTDGTEITYYFESGDGTYDKLSASGKSIDSFRMSYGSGSTNTYGVKDFCINISQPNTSISPHNGEYHPYKTDTLTLPETVTLRSAGSVEDELDVESGVVTHKIYKKTFSASDGWELSGAGNFFLEISDMYQVDYTTQISLLAEYAYDNTNSSIDKTYWNNGRFIFVRDTSFNGDASAFASALAGKKLNYALATPTTESIDPVPDNSIYTEGGGTVETIQTQTPVIDNCLDVGYLAV